MAVDVAAEHGGDVPRQGGAGDDVGAVAEGEVPGAAGGALHAVVQAEEAHVGCGGAGAGPGEEGRKARPDLARIGEAGEGHPDAAGGEHHGAGAIEYMEVRVEGEERVGNPPSLVVAGEQQHRDALVGEAPERGQGGVGEPGRDAAPVEQIAAVEHGVHPAVPGEGEGGLEAGEVAGLEALHRGRPASLLVAEVRVGEEEETHGTVRGGGGSDLFQGSDTTSCGRGR